MARTSTVWLSWTRSSRWLSRKWKSVVLPMRLRNAERRLLLLKEETRQELLAIRELQQRLETLSLASSPEPPALETSPTVLKVREDLVLESPIRQAPLSRELLQFLQPEPLGPEPKFEGTTPPK